MRTIHFDHEQLRHRRIARATRTGRAVSGRDAIHAIVGFGGARMPKPVGGFSGTAATKPEIPRLVGVVIS
ncbi:hypothetical protein J5837_12460 [Pseudoxanthomonas helianthi]|uniref:Uncharacterized protein n=1 Tax=Pseudoxanthomonas helianthi TaxID=1453541 RepID=A0A940X410_9GAMM|nr:hypothetical protein [Pseudoxanthomonas helianthi]MBP3985220.1 hypothetical protein [Pseudoxanthomonas helianthi]